MARVFKSLDQSARLASSAGLDSVMSLRLAFLGLTISRPNTVQATTSSTTATATVGYVLENAVIVSKAGE
ncbi:hypothetical protein SAMN05428989_1599 [Pseudoxanthomonas sp. GM95]|nr:hypothetical protein SAMN05428989_1599 [Pseudoxanthomonas sp. GM95]